MQTVNVHTLNTDSRMLISQLKRGEEAAYEMLFKEYYHILSIFANKYLRDMELAKEQVQELFVNIYERRESLDINSSLKSYLFRSVHNRCINYINAQKIRTKYADHVIKTYETGQNSIEEEINLSELENALFNAIGELPPQCRKIFKMNRFDGLSNNEIAEKLTLSKRTVETQISKALKILRVKLEPFMVACYLALFFLAIRLVDYITVI